MASQNKKNKARNSYMENGGERRDDKMKRINYYKKRDRQKLKVRSVYATDTSAPTEPKTEIKAIFG